MSGRELGYIWDARFVDLLGKPFKITKSPKAVLARLADSANPDFICAHQSIQTIANDLCTTKRAVQRAFVRLSGCPEDRARWKKNCVAAGGRCEQHLGVIVGCGIEIRKGRLWHRYRLRVELLLNKEYKPVVETFCRGPGDKMSPAPDDKMSPLLLSSSSVLRVSHSSSVVNGNNVLPDRPGTTTTVPLELLAALEGKRLSETGENFDRAAIATLYQECLAENPKVTSAAIIDAVNAKIRVNHFTRRPIKSWVGFLLVAVPRAIRREVTPTRTRTKGKP